MPAQAGGCPRSPHPLSDLHHHCRLCPRLSSPLWALGLLPAAAIANDHKLSSFKQQNLISHCSGSQKSRTRMWRSHTPSEGSGRKILPCASPTVSGSYRSQPLVRLRSSSLCLGLHVAFSSLGLCVSSPLLKGTALVRFRGLSQMQDDSSS